MPRSNTANTCAPEDSTVSTTDAEAGALGDRVRVVAPVGGRDGWSAMDAGAAGGGLTPGRVAVGGEALRGWLRGYLTGVLQRDDRILMILSYFEGLNAREIGAVLDATEASVGSRLDVLNCALQKAFRAFLREQAAEG